VSDVPRRSLSPSGQIRPLRVAINGFGRIGRNVLRAWFESFERSENQGLPQIEIVAINDIAPADILTHLLRFDSAHGRFPGTATLVDGHLEVMSSGLSRRMTFLSEADPARLPWAALQVDLVLECTGQFRSRAQASRHLAAGARRVIISAAPFDTVDAAIVVGVNESSLTRDDLVISSVSCTTQALVPLVKILDDAFGIESALMTEIHAMTADQSVLDHAHRDFRRARASAHNIIPTTSSAIGALKRVLPHMADRIEGYSIRVPTLNVAAIDLSVVLRQSVSELALNETFLKAAEGPYCNIMAVTDEPLVSSDFNHQPYSLVVDRLQTLVVGRQVKVLAWYDNEWGYANRLLDICAVISTLDL